MFSYEIYENEGVIVLTSVGKTTYDDYQSVAPEFYTDVESCGIRRILLDARKFEGWDSAKSESMSFTSWFQGRLMFDRIAVVVHDGVSSEVDRFLEYFQNAGKDVRVFPPSQYGSALDWLKQNAASN